MTPAVSKTVTPLLNIQALRAAAALLVVFVHMRDLELKYSPDHILPKLFSLGIVGVDLFFVISGFIMIYVCWGLRTGGKTSAGFLFARFARIYPVYWLIAGAVFCVWKLNPALINYDPAASKLWRSALLFPDYYAPMLKVAWTLIHELYFYLVFSLCLLLPRLFWIGALSVWAAVIWGMNQSGLCPISPVGRLMTNPINIEFYFGVLIGWIVVRRRSQDRASAAKLARTALLLGSICLLGAMIYQSYFAPDIFPSNGTRTVIFGVPAALIIYGLVSLEAAGHKAHPALARSGNWSYALYLAHIPILSGLFVLWRTFARPGAIDNIIVMPIFIGTALAASALIWRGFERPLLTLSRRIRRRIER